MFTVKAIREGASATHAYEAMRYSLYDKGDRFEVSIEEPGKAEPTMLVVSVDRLEAVIIENAAGKNVEHVRRRDLNGERKAVPVPDVDVTINGERRKISGAKVMYEHLVELAGMKGNPSVTVRFGDRSREGTIVSPGKLVELDAGAMINVVHTGNA